MSFPPGTGQRGVAARGACVKSYIDEEGDLMPLVMTPGGDFVVG